MTIDRIDLYEYFGITREKGVEGYLTTYIHAQPDEHCKGRIRPAMVIFGGGGYSFISNREKEPIALAYMNNGFNSFVLEYSCAPSKFPTQLIEGCMAVAYVRENANKYNIDPEHICAIGFSAGGHLCGTVATLYNDEIVLSALKNKAKYCRPDAVILSYPVITLKQKTHVGTCENISGGDENIIKIASVEDNVNKSTPPAFIWTTVDDGSVPSENSLMIASAYKKAGVSFELHMFESGVHGLSLATKETTNHINPSILINENASKWFNLSINWLVNKGFEIKI